MTHWFIGIESSEILHYAFDEYNINSNLERIEVGANGRMDGTRSLNTSKLHKRSRVSTSR